MSVIGYLILVIGLLVIELGLAVLFALMFRRMFIASLKTEIKPARMVIAASRFELMAEEKARQILAGRNDRDPLVCAVLSLLHSSKADAAGESGDAKNPEWLANRFTGALHGLMQFEADLKEALSAPAEPEQQKKE